MMQRYLHLCFVALVAVVLAACSSDAPEPKSESTVQITLSAPQANLGDYTGEALDCELIKWYRIAITSTTDRKILRCIDKTLEASQVADLVTEVQLGEGTYNVYAFANIDLNYLAAIGIKPGGTVPDNIAQLRYHVPNYFAATAAQDGGKLEGSLVSTASFEAAGHYVPMTSRAPQQIEVTERVTQTYNIELRRLFAKLEFVFRNTTPQDLQVNALAVENMTVNAGDAGSILLMNYEEPRTSINLPSDLKPATLTHTFASPAVVASKGAEVHHSFYVLESQSSSVTNAFGLSFSVTKSGEAPTSAAVDHMRYGLTSASTITLIHRNDWIVIPITFSEWQMRLEVHSYAPIGGYPDAVIDENESGEFVAKFKSGGKFTLRPFIRKHYEGNPWFGVVEKGKVQGPPTIAISGDDLFEVVPALTSTGEIVGKMRTGKGTACITLSVNVIESTTPSLTTRTLTRKIYVTQE